MVVSDPNSAAVDALRSAPPPPPTRAELAEKARAQKTLDRMSRREVVADA